MIPPSECLCKYDTRDGKSGSDKLSDHCSLKTEWLTTEGAAKYLQVSVQALRNMTSNRKFPYYKLERRNRYKLEDLQKFLLKNPRGGFYGN